MKREYQPWRAPGLLLCGFVVFGTWMLYAHGRTYFYTNDSFGYIDEARHLLAGQGLMRANLDFTQPDLGPLPTALFPPFFGVLIAGVSTLGIDPGLSALLLSWAGWMLLPLALFWGARPMLGTWASLALALVVSTSPGVVQWGSRAMSDVSALLVSVFAFGLLVRGLVAASGTMLLAAGMLVGLDVGLRNAYLANLMAAMVVLLLAAPLRLLTRRQVLRSALCFGLGVAAPLAVLWGRNWVVFGALQPFVAGTPAKALSVATVLTSLREHLWEVLIDATGSESVAMLAWDARLLLLIGVPLLLVLAWGLRRYWRAAPAAGRLYAVLCAAMCALAPALIVYANARFGAYHEYRYPIQYVWCAFALAFAALGALWPAPAARFAAVAAGLATAMLVYFHAAFLHLEVAREQLVQAAWNRLGLVQGTHWAAEQGWRRQGIQAVLQLRLRMTRDRELRDTLHRLPADAIVIATGEFGNVLSFESGRRVYTVWNFKDAAEKERLALTAEALRRRRPGQEIVYLLIPDHELLLESGGLDEALRSVLPRGFSITEMKPEFYVAKFDAG